MEVLHPNCAGLDVHKDTVVACSRRMVGSKVEREVCTFKTTTSGLLDLSAWLADLLAHGLVRGSFVPDRATQEQRGLLRTRKQMTRERTSHVQLLQKTLEDANIKLDSVITDIVGASGRRMIAALIGGETDPGKLASLASNRLKASQADLQEALRGRVTKQHRFLLKLHLAHIDTLDRALAEIDAEVEANLAPFRSAIDILTTIPGVGELVARVIVSEIGIAATSSARADMSRFPTAGHLIS